VGWRVGFKRCLYRRYRRLQGESTNVYINLPSAGEVAIEARQTR
jgi:hypothetical protein